MQAAAVAPAEAEEEMEVLRCQISEWYPKFKSHTFRTLFHPLPQPFLRYLLGLNPTSPPRNEDHNLQDEGEQEPPSPPPFLLPRPASGRDPLPRPTAGIDPTSLLDCSSQLSVSDEDDDDAEETDSAPSFPDLEAAVERSIAALGGAAFPKLNWSAPKDAAWIAADGTLRCSTFADVALLLHASDSIAHDLSSHPISSSSSSPFAFYLALRMWYPSLRPEMEFRCFVRHHRLVAICQREVTNFYPALLERRHHIKSLIHAFFSNVIRPSFESQSYTFDVYVTNDGRVKLIDFNPWRAFTLPLLFTWQELDGEHFKSEEEEEGEDEVTDREGRRAVEYRIVENQCGVRPGLKTAVPYDYLDTGEGSGWDQFLRKADEELRKQAQSVSGHGDNA